MVAERLTRSCGLDVSFDRFRINPRPPVASSKRPQSMMKKYPEILVSLLATAVLAGCQSATTANPGPAFAAYRSPYPKSSGVAISRVLEEDAIHSLKVYLKQKRGSDSFEIVERKSFGAAKDFFVDGKGRLVGGSLHEIWTIRHASEVRKYEFIMFPDGQGGNTVGFKDYRG